MKMSNTLPLMSSGSEPEGRAMIMDEKKRKRMISNRESARRSRMKKQKRLENLVNEVASLKAQIRNNTNRHEVLMQKTVVLELENNVLKVQKMELDQYLRDLELMQTQMELLQMNLMMMQQQQSGSASASGSFPGETVDIKEPKVVQTWQCHGSTQPAIMASAGMLNY